MPGKHEVQQLVDGMDSIPNLMRRLSVAPASPGRYQVAPPNHSYGMEATLQIGCDQSSSHASKNKDKSKYAQRKDKRMMEQAKKIVAHLSKIQPDGGHAQRPERTLHEVAAKAKESLLKHMKKVGVGSGNKGAAKLFWNYDPAKKGTVKYDDLGQVLIASGSAIDPNESYMLAHHLDQGKTGMLPYKDLLKNLEAAAKLKDGISMSQLLRETAATKKAAAAATKRAGVDDKATKKGKGAQKKKPHQDEKDPAHRSLQSHLLREVEEEAKPKKTQADIDADEEARRSSALAVKATKKKHQTRKQKMDDVSAKMLENSLVVQLQGQFAGLRNILRHMDKSGSGYVNKSEFNAALRHAGVICTKDELGDLFSRNSRSVAVDSAIGLNNGKAVNLEDFVMKLRTRANAPAFAHLSRLTRTDAAQRREEMRVMRKVLDATGMAESALGVFREMQEPFKDWVEPDALLKGLNKLGCNLDENEFATLVEKVDANNDGKIEVQEFDDYLHTAVHEHTETEQRLKHEALANHCRYSRSYASSDILYSHLQPTYEKMTDSKEFRKENLAWAKLKYGLQDKRVAVLRAFQQSGYGVTDLQSTQLAVAKPDDVTKQVDISELGERLTAAGAPLGQEDLDTLGRKMSFIEKDNKVAMSDFCEVVGIPLAVSNSKMLVAEHPCETTMDGGVFNSSMKSQVSHQTNATSMMLSSVDDTALVKGNRRRHIPQTVQVHNTPGGTSRFWEMTHGVDESKRVAHVPKGDIKWEKAAHMNKEKRGRTSLADAVGGSGRRSSSAPATSRGIGQVSSALRWVGNKSLAQFIAAKPDTASRLNFTAGGSDGPAPISGLKKRVPRHPRPPPYATHL